MIFSMVMTKKSRVFATCDIGDAINMLRHADTKLRSIRSRKLRRKA